MTYHHPRTHLQRPQTVEEARAEEMHTHDPVVVVTGYNRSYVKYGDSRGYIFPLFGLRSIEKATLRALKAAVRHHDYGTRYNWVQRAKRAELETKMRGVVDANKPVDASK